MHEIFVERQRVLELLCACPALGNERSRRAIAVRCGLDAELVASVDLTGDSITVVPLLVDALVQYGVLRSNGIDALESFLGTIRTMVGGQHKDILDEFLAHWKSLPASVRTRSDALNAYLRHLVAKWENFESPLLPPTVSLSSIHLSLRLTDVPKWAYADQKTFLHGYRKLGLQESHVVTATLWDFLSHGHEQSRWIILGDPGTGKTTLLLRESATRAQDALENAQPVFPLFVPFGLFASRAMVDISFSIYDFLDELGRGLGITGLGAEIRAIVKAGHVILFLDGLDEVADSGRRDLLTRVEAHFPLETGNQIVISSRKVGFSGISGFVPLEIQPLSVEQQRKLLIAVCGMEKTAILLRHMSGRRNFQDMAAIPMTLTILALVAREGPDELDHYLYKQSDLFKLAIEILLEGRHKNDQGVRSAEKAERILSQASLFLQKRGGAETVPETFNENLLIQAVKVSGDSLPPWDGARDFIKDVAKRSNIVYPVDCLQQVYRYLHRTFREYLAANALSELPPDALKSLIAEVASRQSWAEVLVLLGGLVPNANDYLRELARGPEDLALRALREVKNLDKNTALDILKLKGSDIHARSQVFKELPAKLVSDDRTVDVLRAYLDAMGIDVPRVDIYFIGRILRAINSGISRDLLTSLLARLPPVPAGILETVQIARDRRPYWCALPEGAFLFGGASDDPDRPGWVPSFTKVSTSSFDIARVPVTNRLYECFDPSHRLNRAFEDEVEPRELDDHPVVKVSWYEAKVFCSWIAQENPGVGLPTECQWEKGAAVTAAGNKLRFPWGDEWDSSKLNHWSSGPNHTTRVGSYPEGASPCGALDCAGNVWEWCSDWFCDDPDQFSRYLKENSQNPSGVSTGERKVDRGGGWYHDVGVPCTFLRAADDPADVFTHCGFRLARV